LLRGDRGELGGGLVHRQLSGDYASRLMTRIGTQPGILCVNGLRREG
jgi:hypothetical protein